MNKYNPNIHHRRSIRLKGYDYAQAGLYFITICCQDRICRFGRVENGKMILNEYGIIARDEWLKTPEIRQNIALGAYVIMPNHIHGIIHLSGRGELHSPNMTNTPNTSESHSPEMHRGEFNSPLRSPSQTVGAIVRGYKSSVTKQLGTLGFTEKLWQRNYYEHIIRNEQSYQTISDYIINNPVKWQDDKFYIT